MKIIEDLSPNKKVYKFEHHNCCVFEANGDEFKWVVGQYNETTASVICPKCGKQFYFTPKFVREL